MNIQDVENLAALARLELSEGEKKAMLKDLHEVLGYVKIIQEAEVDDSPSQEGLYNVWRKDEPGVPPFSTDLIISQFPEEQENFLKVKKIL